jgi:hypothetical protein
MTIVIATNGFNTLFVESHGNETSYNEKDNLLRITLTSEKGGIYKWYVAFESEFAAFLELERIFNRGGFIR